MAPPNAMITAAAILPRQNDAQFIGYVSLGTAFSQPYSAVSCNAGLSFYLDGRGFAGCCATTAATCNPITYCGNGILTYAAISGGSGVSTQPCTRIYGSTDTVCNTAFIFENTADNSPKTDIFCGNTALRLSVYRSINTDQSVAASSVTTSSSSSPTPLPDNGGGHKSKAWIAGAVIGPIVGLALIGAIIFFLLGRKKKSKTAPQAGGAAMADPSQPPAGVGGYTEGKPDAYAGHQQAGYNPHNSFVPVSPVPGYAPTHSNPGSPPPQQAYPTDTKYAHNGPPADGPAELGGGTATGAHHPGPATHPAPAAEMGT